MDSEPELRQNIVSGEWVLIAPGRGKRPTDFVKHSQKPTPKTKCPFEDPQRAGNGAPLLWYSKNRKENDAIRPDWTLQVIQNKFPAVMSHGKTCPVAIEYGPYEKMKGVGFHEVVVTRDHNTSLSDMTPEDAARVVDAYHERFLAHEKEKCIEYIFIFHNHGEAAGASVWHPHSQIIALPIVPPDVSRSLAGSKYYWQHEKACVHCNIIKWERAKKQRIVYQNKEYIVIAPFASHVAFEMRVFPLKHSSRFEHTTATSRLLFADALTQALHRLKKILKNPPYNFFIHTAPLGDGEFDYYHWHVEILPKTAHHAGVELGTGIEVVTMSPESAAGYLRAV